MIGKLSGMIDDISEDHVIVDVNGVGYLVYSSEVLNFHIGDKVKLYIETHVREDAINLYGFSTLAHKQTFIALITVNGIGPKVALNILSKLPPENLQQAIMAKDLFAFKQISGIGTKLAERIILELNNKALFKAGSNLNIAENQGSSAVNTKSHTIFNDAVMGLINLGMTYGEASSYVNAVIHSSEDVGEIMSNALKLRGSKVK